MPRGSITATYSLFFIFLSGVFFAGNILERDQNTLLLLAFGSSFFAYFWICQFEELKFRDGLILGLLARLILFFSLPTLSDDYFRFIWDGTLVNLGQNPYEYIPVDVNKILKGLDQIILQKMNSPEYFSVYPPLNQLIFWLASSLGGSVLGSVNTIRIFILLADFGTVTLLRKLGNSKTSFWYFLNPLTILELTGNLHFEGLVIFFIVLFIYLIKTHKAPLAGISLGLAIATKLIPLIFIPVVLWSYRWRKAFTLSLPIFILTSLSFWPILHTGLSGGMTESLSLYFQSFEFNGSFYYLFREFGYWAVGYNTISTLGPSMAKYTLLMILALTFFGYKKLSLEFLMLASLLIYLLFSTTVHPWYVLPLIPLGLLSGYYFPVLWSFLIFLTYQGYTPTGYENPVLWNLTEYLTLFVFMFYEMRKKYVEAHHTT